VECTIEGCGAEGVKLGYCHNCRRKLSRRGVNVEGYTEMPVILALAPRISPKELHEMRRCKQLGWSTRKIAKYLGVNQSTVCRHLNSAG